MAVKLTNGPATLLPVALSSYRESHDGGPLVHRIIGTTAVDVTMRPLGLRTGSFVLDFRSAALSVAAATAFQAARVWTLEHSDVPTLDMEFIVRSVTRDVAGDGRWPVAVEFEEIS